MTSLPIAEVCRAPRFVANWMPRDKIELSLVPWCTVCGELAAIDLGWLDLWLESETSLGEERPGVYLADLDRLAELDSETIEVETGVVARGFRLKFEQPDADKEASRLLPDVEVTFV